MVPPFPICSLAGSLLDCGRVPCTGGGLSALDLFTTPGVGDAATDHEPRARRNECCQQDAGRICAPANMVTEGYREVDARGVETQSGVKVQVRTLNREGVDPVKAVDRRFSALMYRANLEVVRVADEMLGETTDLLA